MVHKIALLQHIKALNYDAIHKVAEYLRDANLAALAREYTANLKKRDVDIGFNLFELISDHYYRETFHSDILNALLDPVGKHKGQDKYLKLFLQFLCEQHRAKINPQDYSKAQVVKEQGRIDILTDILAINVSQRTSQIA